MKKRGGSVQRVSPASEDEVQDILFHLKGADPAVIVNTIPTESFVRTFYQKPLD